MKTILFSIVVCLRLVEGAAALRLLSALDARGAVPAPDLELWLKADSFEDASDRSTIDVWADSSDHGRNAVAYTRAPQLFAAAVGGRPAVHFDATRSFAIPDSPAWQLADFTIFLVARRNPPVCSYDWWSGVFLGQDVGSGQPTKWALGFGTGAARDRFELTGSGFGGAGFSFQLPFASFGLFELHRERSRFRGYLDGKLQCDAHDVGEGSISDMAVPLTIGFWEWIYDPRPRVDSGFGGDCAELLIFSSALSEERRLEMGDYLAEKHGFASAYLPPPRLTARLLSDGSILVSVSGRPGMRGVLQRSNDLRTWEAAADFLILPNRTWETTFKCSSPCCFFRAGPVL